MKPRWKEEYEIRQKIEQTRKDLILFIKEDKLLVEPNIFSTKLEAYRYTLVSLDVFLKLTTPKSQS